MTGALRKKGNWDTGTHTGEHHVKMQAEIARCFHNPENSKIASKPPEVGKETWDRFSLTALEGTHSADMLISELTVKFCCLSPPV